MVSKSHLDRRVTAPGRLLYLTEPARAAVDLGLFAASAPLLAALPRPQSPERHPVLVLPGLGGGDSPNAALRALLSHLGYPAAGWGLGRNLGPTARVIDGLPTRLDELTSRFGGPVTLIGVSLGGIYAHQLAARTPEAVRQVITVGSPVALSRLGQPEAPRPEYWSGVPRWPHWARWARWYARLSAELAGLPGEAGAGLPVPATSIYSRLDGIVGWRACLNEPAPHAENIAVTASHLALVYHPAVIFAIADRLAQPAGHWRPFRPPPRLRAAYRQPEGQP